MRKTPPLPLPVKRALARLGEDIRNARLRRRIPTTIMAERAFITRMTLRKVERGDPSVSLGIYAVVLFVLGLTQRLADLADVRSDDLGLRLEEERLPKRIRRSRKSAGSPAATIAS
jgi:transcriptional regulator with XRE-family HTH domain